MSKPTPIFEAPWHAQLFALTVHLHEKGVFTWPDWTVDFGVTLADHRLSGDLNGGDDYFNAWLATLERVLQDNKMASGAAVEDMRSAWEQAYLSTPHGHPVKLPA
ncbi:nitrile hydratase accessory protein [Shimia gijangensis]|uniref:Nitrile hydratase accessory protein n=1 Tax=Shimia gijangensis TaxID=1470563 RepID=A0A1M6E044_9RHOB|nr:nitrile hydratase accessory protein [Shimia gijangensis]SHI78750.1 nitrile hydratase accessory protein [Shimia gijangensis]